MPPILAASAIDIAPFFIELGIVFVALAVVGRLANRIGLSPIPFYLLVGMAFGSSGLYPLSFSQEFIELSAEIGVILLLFMLGLEYSGAELSSGLRRGALAGVVDVVLNFTPGLLFGFLLEWNLTAALLLGGVTYISSSGIISKLLGDLGWLGNRETPAILSILVFEDLVMAAYLPLMSVLLVGAAMLEGLMSLGVAALTVVIVMFIALRWGQRLSHLMATRSNEMLLLTVLAAVLLVAGITQRLEVSAAVGAFLVGIALSEPIVERVHDLMAPLKDLFAAIFFVFFSLQIDPASLLPVLDIALLLGLITGLAKLVTGIFAARQMGVALPGQMRAGTLLMIRGEFSIVIAGLATAAGLEIPQLVPLTAAYVLVMAIIGSILVRVVNPLVRQVLERRRRPA
jgi:monovalent cation:H+ antiporter-2, CPA2 family